MPWLTMGWTAHTCAWLLLIRALLGAAQGPPLVLHARPEPLPPDRPFLQLQAYRAELRRGLSCPEEHTESLSTTGAALRKLQKAHLEKGIHAHVDIIPVVNDLTLTETTEAAVRYAMRQKQATNGSVIEITRGGALYSMVAVAAGAAGAVAVAPNEMLVDATRMVVQSNPSVAAKVALGVAVSTNDRCFCRFSTPARMAASMASAAAPILSARASLLKPGGSVIPSEVRIYGVLVESECLRRRNRVDTMIEGFCLRHLNEVRRTGPAPQSSSWRKPNARPISEVFEIHRVDLRVATQVGDVLPVDVRVTRGGSWDAVISWSAAHYRTGDQEEAVLHGGPVAGALRGPHWAESVQMVGSPRSVSAGEIIRLVPLQPECVKCGFDLSDVVTANSSQVRAWHFPMINDRDRNDAFNQAITRAVQQKRSTLKQVHVLDIGSGSGLLALMAAKAGAEQVTTVEADAALARVAKKVIATNGLNGKIYPLHRMSTQIRIPADMPRKVDLVVSEILGSDILNEGVRPTICDAAARLAKSDAVFIPSSARLMAQLVQSSELRDQSVVSEVLGFDLSALTELQVLWERDMGPVRHRALTPVINLTRFDLTKCESGGADRFDVKLSASGRVDAVVFWYEIVLDERTTISTGIGAGDAHVGQWGQAIKFVEQETIVKRGQRGEILVHHDDLSIDLRYVHHS